MKKTILIMTALFFVLSNASAKSHSINLGYTCDEMQVAIGNITTSYTDNLFEYEISYCSKEFSATGRYIKFTLTFTDKDGNILDETSSGPVISKGTVGTHTAGITLSEMPYNCRISWYYKDMSIPESDWKTIIEPDGTTTRQRSTETDPEWKLMAIRSLKLNQ